MNFVMPKTSLAIATLLICLVVPGPLAFSQPAATSTFVDFVSKRLTRELPDTTKQSSQAADVAKFCDVNKSVFARRVFTEYGAMFVASNSVMLPEVCYFPDEKTAKEFQSKLQIKVAVINGTEIRLQEAAMNSLLAVVIEVLSSGGRVSPLDGSIAGGRSYMDTVNIWNSRFEPALRYWTRKGKITTEEAAQTRILPFEKQVEKIIEWESQRLWFGTARSGSIFSSTAPPGSSQHLALLAFDVAKLPAPKLVTIFNAHGWYQTVKGDPQHFTYLGVTEPELPGRGLIPIYSGGTKYWLPNI
jgi:hypothetical protein